MTETLLSSLLGSLLALTLWHVTSHFGRRRAERLVAEENARLDRLTRDLRPGFQYDAGFGSRDVQKTIDQIKRDRIGRMERARDIYSGKPSGKESA